MITRTPIITLRIIIILFFDFKSEIGSVLDSGSGSGLGSGFLFSSEQTSTIHLLLL